MSEWEGNVQVNSYTNFPKSFKIIVHICGWKGASLLSCAAGSQQQQSSTLGEKKKNSSSTWTGQRQSKLKQTTKKSVKNIEYLYIKEKQAKFWAMKGIQSCLCLSNCGESPLCFSPFSCRRWNTCRFQHTSGPLNILLTQMTDLVQD